MERYHWNKRFTPSLISIWCFHPNECSLLTSTSLRGVPSGLLLSNTISPLKLTAFATNSDNCLMVISLPVPMLMWQLRISPKCGNAPPRPSLLLRSMAPSDFLPKQMEEVSVAENESL